MRQVQILRRSRRVRELAELTAVPTAAASDTSAAADLLEAIDALVD
jgi:hypothetical protein